MPFGPLKLANLRKSEMKMMLTLTHFPHISTNSLGLGSTPPKSGNIYAGTVARRIDKVHAAGDCTACGPRTEVSVYLNITVSISVSTTSKRGLFIYAHRICRILTSCEAQPSHILSISQKRTLCLPSADPSGYKRSLKTKANLHSNM